jgi:lysophospholipid acyltransferase (LPLAT)-like uncharacterized protein
MVARVWLWTLRVEVDEDPRLAEANERPWVLAFQHGTQWPLLAWRRRSSTAVMVSLSLDGALQARALRALGFVVVRGSTSRDARRGLTSLVRAVRKGGSDAAFAVDGPRGPRGVARGGARLAARAVGGVLVPMGAAVGCGMTFTGAWDQFLLAWPFTRVVVRLGAPIDPSARVRDVDLELSSAIADANRVAEERLLRGPVAGSNSTEGAGVLGLPK